MIDGHVQRLLAQAIDSPTKLHLLLIFHDHPRLEVTAMQMAERTCRDIWSVSQSLRELAEDGILEMTHAAGEPVYVYGPRVEYIDPIHTLMLRYNDPLQRDQLHRSIRELASYAPFRRTAAGSGNGY